MTDSTDEDAPACHHCGERAGPSSEQRVVTTVEDGTAVYKHFCSDGCLETWEMSGSA
ncbi:DUF7576 family protein [Natrinema caseinilyticum]|uniref:DUF7576 family protein n=1 Tax=Natrinema caseinilyticum TaxID=2961570 RepID=UPI0020C3EC96|nr:hypothetical protein [Natrinema caseinilyticum]